MPSEQNVSEITKKRYALIKNNKIATVRHADSFQFIYRLRPSRVGISFNA